MGTRGSGERPWGPQCRRPVAARLVPAPKRLWFQTGPARADNVPGMNSIELISGTRTGLWLAAIAALTSCLWIPYVLDRLVRLGVMGVFGNQIGRAHV